MGARRWTWARRAFLTAWAVGLVLAAWGLIQGRHLSFHLAGVPWQAPAWAAWVAMAVVWLDAVLEMSVAPPSFRQAIGEWGLFLLFAGVTAIVFAVSLWFILILPRPLLALFPFLRIEPFFQMLYSCTFVLVYMGLFWFMGALAQTGIAPAIRRSLRGWLLGGPPGQEEILRRLEAAKLPAAETDRFVRRIQEEGLSPALVREMVDWAEDRMEKMGSSPARAILVQTLNNWLEAQEGN